MTKVNMVRWLKQVQGEWEAEQINVNPAFKRSDGLFAWRVLGETPSNTYSEIKDLNKTRMPNPDTMKRMALGLDNWRPGYGTLLYLMAEQQPPMPTHPLTRRMLQLFLACNEAEQEELIRDLSVRHPEVQNGEYQQAMLQV